MARAAAASLPPSRFPRATWRRAGRSSRAPPSTPAWWMPTACIARPARRACSSPRRPPSRPSKSRPERIQAGDVLVLMCRGPMGSGMEEIFEITVALKLPGFRQARGRHHRRPLQRRFHRRVHRPRHARSAGRRPARQDSEGDRIEIVIDRVKLEGLHQPGERRQRRGGIANPRRAPVTRRPGARPGPALGDAPLGRARRRGTWGGCVYDTSDSQGAEALTRELRGRMSSCARLASGATGRVANPPQDAILIRRA
jgi:hypothetical protein